MPRTCHPTGTGRLATVGWVIAEDDVAGIDSDSVTAWLARHVEGAVAPFRFDIIAGGHSNLTYRVVCRRRSSLVLRRPPLGHVLASAHDMGREFRIISGLQDCAVPGAAGARPVRRRAPSTARRST